MYTFIHEPKESFANLATLLSIFCTAQPVIARYNINKNFESANHYCNLSCWSPFFQNIFKDMTVCFGLLAYWNISVFRMGIKPHHKICILLFLIRWCSWRWTNSKILVFLCRWEICIAIFTYHVYRFKGHQQNRWIFMLGHDKFFMHANLIFKKLPTCNFTLSEQWISLANALITWYTRFCSTNIYQYLKKNTVR